MFLSAFDVGMVTYVWIAQVAENSWIATIYTVGVYIHQDSVYSVDIFWYADEFIRRNSLSVVVNQYLTCNA